MLVVGALISAVVGWVSLKKAAENIAEKEITNIWCLVFVFGACGSLPVHSIHHLRAG